MNKQNGYSPVNELPDRQPPKGQSGAVQKKEHHHMNNESEVLGRIDNMKSLTTELAEQAGALKRITTHFRDNLEELDLLLTHEGGFDAAHQIEIAYHFYEDLPQGSFATKLMSAWVQADPPNRRRIEIGFPYIGETMRYLANNKNTSLAKLKQILTKNQNLI